MLRCVGIEYSDFPTVEWTLYFKNTSDKDTPILADIQAIDVSLDRAAGRGRVSAASSCRQPCRTDDYQPLETVLTPGMEKANRGRSAAGRPIATCRYFNLQQPDNEGMIVVVGWPGQWVANFARDKDEPLAYSCRPGVDALQAAAGRGGPFAADGAAVLEGRPDSCPKRVASLDDGPQYAAARRQAAAAAVACMQLGAYCSEMIDANAAEPDHVHRSVSGREAEDRLLVDGRRLVLQRSGWWQDGHVGGRPQAISEGAAPSQRSCARQRHQDPPLVRARAGLVRHLACQQSSRMDFGRGRIGGLLNLGNPDAWKWLVEHVDKMITEQGIDLYRQDFNMDPLSFWRGNDAPDRQGITEIKYVMGYLAFWDELLRRHPNMLIDRCASGGRRNDLETLRRAVPLWRSDYLQPIGQQCIPTASLPGCPTSAAHAGCLGQPLPDAQRALPRAHLRFDMRQKERDYTLARRLVAPIGGSSAATFLATTIP